MRAIFNVGGKVDSGTVIEFSAAYRRTTMVPGKVNLQVIMKHPLTGWKSEIKEFDLPGNDPIVIIHFEKKYTVPPDTPAGRELCLCF